MSSLKTNNISNLNGTLTIPTDTAIDLIDNGTAKAWVNFNGTGTVAIRAAYNVSSITDNGVGDYTVNFTNAMPDANYSLVATSQYNTTGNEADHAFMGMEIKSITTPLITTSARIQGKYGGNTTTYDMTSVCVSVFR